MQMADEYFEFHHFLHILCPVLIADQHGILRLYDDHIIQPYRGDPKISIDYGIMERADNVIMLEGNFDWNDEDGCQWLSDAPFLPPVSWQIP